MVHAQNRIVLEKESNKRDFEIQTDPLIPARRQNLMQTKKENIVK